MAQAQRTNEPNNAAETTVSGGSPHDINETIRGVLAPYLGPRGKFRNRYRPRVMVFSAGLRDIPYRIRIRCFTQIEKRYPADSCWTEKTVWSVEYAQRLPWDEGPLKWEAEELLTDAWALAQYVGKHVQEKETRTLWIAAPAENDLGCDPTPINTLEVHLDLQQYKQVCECVWEWARYLEALD